MGENEFSPCATMLCFEVDLREVGSSLVKIRNEERRAIKVAATITDILRKGSIPARELLSVMGRVQFAG